MKFVGSFLFLCLLYLIEANANSIAVETSNATPEQVPWAVVLKEKETDDVECMGALLTLSHVVTTGDCVASRELQAITFGGLIYGGVVSRVWADCVKPCQSRRPKAILVNEGYFSQQPGLFDNIAVLVLNKPFDPPMTFIPTVKVRPAIDANVTTLGFLDKTGEVQNNLQFVKLSMIPYDSCNIPEFQRGKRFCASMQFGISGGPLIDHSGALVGLACHPMDDPTKGLVASDITFYSHFLERLIKNESGSD